MAKYIETTMDKIYRVLGTTGWYATVFGAGVVAGAFISLAIR